MTTAPAPASAPPMPPGTAERRYPAAGVQTRFWLLHELFPDAPLCNEGIALRLRGDLDVDVLQGTLVAIVQRHESLRASFQQSTAGVTVHIAPAAAVPFEQVNLEAADPDSRQRLLEGIARTATSGRFDLSAPPLLRATLVRESPDSHVLLLVFHHIIADGTSFLKLFPAELAELYPALRDGRTPVPLPPVTSYRDFVRASLGDEQRARVESGPRVLAGGAGGRAALPAAAHRSSLSRPPQRPGRPPGAATAARGSPAGAAAGGRAEGAALRCHRGRVRGPAGALQRRRRGRAWHPDRQPRPDLQAHHRLLHQRPGAAHPAAGRPALPGSDRRAGSHPARGPAPRQRPVR